MSEESRFYILRIGDEQVGIAQTAPDHVPALDDTELVFSRVFLHGPALLKAQNVTVSGRPQVLRHVAPPLYDVRAPDGTVWPDCRLMSYEAMIMQDRGPAHVLVVGARLVSGAPSVVKESTDQPR